MYSHNYKGLPYKMSLCKFIEDYRFRYNLYGKYTKWTTAAGKKIRVKDIDSTHLKRIVGYFGNTHIRTKYPYVWYRYIFENLNYLLR